MNRTMKKLMLAAMAVALLAAFLCGCGNPVTPDVVVNDFLTAIQSGDLEKASQYVLGNDGSELDELSEIYNDEMTQAMFANYRFDKPVLVSNDGTNALVKVKITSVDFNGVMQQVYADALEAVLAGNTDISEDHMTQMFVDAMTSKDAVMAERELILGLQKDSGKFKILPDDNLFEAILAGSTTFDF